MLVDLITAIIRRGGLFNLGEEFRKVIQPEWRLMLLQKRHHLPRNVTFIEAVARGDDAGCAAFGCCGVFSFDHECQRMRESGQLDRFTGFIHRAVGLQPIALIAGPLLEKIEIAFNGCRRARPEREAVARILDGSSGHLLEAHRAPFFEHGQSGVNRSRDYGGVETLPPEGPFAWRVTKPGGGLWGPD